jgi:hypothetical protein
MAAVYLRGEARTEPERWRCGGLPTDGSSHGGGSTGAGTAPSGTPERLFRAAGRRTLGEAQDPCSSAKPVESPGVDYRSG